MRLGVSKGSRVVVMTTDHTRINQVISHNEGAYDAFYKVDIGSGSSRVSKLVDGAEERITTQTVGPDGTVQKTLMSGVNFLRKTLPSLSNVLAVIMITNSRSIYDMPPPSLQPTSSIVVMVPDLELLPSSWMANVDDVIDAELVDLDDVEEVLGVRDKRFEGLVYGELVAVAQKPIAGLDELAAEANKLRVRRLRLAGFTVEQTPSLDTIPLDSFLRSHLKTKLSGNSALMLVGAPGSGKTFLAKAIGGSLGVPTYSLSAGELISAAKERLGETLAILRNASNTAFIINEFDRLVDAEPRLKTSFLTFLEKIHQGGDLMVVGTAVDIGKMVDKIDNRLTSELLRPGRIDEIIPITPPTEKTTKEGLLREAARQINIKIPDEDIKRICKAAYLLYPSDYLTIARLYRERGLKGAMEYDVDVDARKNQLHSLIEKLRAIGNTSPQVLDMAENTITSRWLA